MKHIPRLILCTALALAVGLATACDNAGTRKFLNQLDNIALLTGKARQDIEIFVDAKRLAPAKALTGNALLDKIDSGNKKVVAELQVFLVPVLNSDGTPKVDGNGKPIKELRIDEAGKVNVDKLIGALSDAAQSALADPNFITSLSASDRQLWQAIISEIAQIIKQGRVIFAKVKPGVVTRVDNNVIPTNSVKGKIIVTATPDPWGRFGIAMRQGSSTH